LDESNGPSPDLRANALDHGVALLRGLAGAIPLAGSLLAEILGSIIPRQREDRLAAYLEAVARRLDETRGQVDTIAQLVAELSPNGLALFEEGARSAVRALTPDRIRGIARIVADGLTAADEDAARERLVLELLDTLTDADVSRLYGMTQTKSWGEVRAERVARGLPPDPVPDVEPVPTTVQEAHALSLRRAETRALDTYEPLRLVRLGLLVEKLEVQPLKRLLGGGAYAPPPRPVGYQLTPMARLVLSRLERHGALPK
jgi:hypothetical protein